MTKKTGTIDGNANSHLNALFAYNLNDIKMCIRMKEISHMMWIARLKERWGIFWRIPYWLHGGQEPISHATK